jgi:hypothetical protein
MDNYNTAINARPALIQEKCIYQKFLSKILALIQKNKLNC